MALGKLVAVIVGGALVVRVARSRHQRFMHPSGRSFAGELEIFGLGDPGGSALLSEPARHDVTVRLSKGVGTRGDRADVRGLAVRVHLPSGPLDLLLSTAGRGPVTRHLPVPRRSFDTVYGSITAYRTGSGRKLYVAARPDPAGPALGRSVESLAPGNRLLLAVRHRGVGRTVGRVTLGQELPPPVDDALAFDAVRNSRSDLHPSGLVHGVRAFAYRQSQRWRGAVPAAPDHDAVARTISRR